MFQLNKDPYFLLERVCVDLRPSLVTWPGCSYNKNWDGLQQPHQLSDKVGIDDRLIELYKALKFREGTVKRTVELNFKAVTSWFD